MDLLEALNTAIQYERRIRDYYAESSRRSKDPKGQRIFAILAREEQGHVDYLESRLEEWQVSGAVTEAELTSILPAPALLREEAEKLKGSAPRTGVDLFKDEVDLLKEALEMERTTSGFYEELVLALDPEHRGLFARFLEIEGGHVTIVQAEIDALVGHGHWFDFMEFSLEQA
jgi:rubrerythrin